MTLWGPCLQNTQTHVESVVCASYRDDKVELKRPALLTLPMNENRRYYSKLGLRRCESSRKQAFFFF